MSSMAGRAELVPHSEVLPVTTTPGRSVAEQVQVDMVKEAAAKLYGHGFTRRQVLLKLLPHLAPKEREGKRDRTKEEQESLARSKLRRWESQQKFRDLVYQHAVVELDMEIPNVLKGVSKKAKTGRVDAARLVLEVSGRHNPKGDQQAPNITVQIANIPRPD